VQEEPPAECAVLVPAEGVREITPRVGLEAEFCVFVQENAIDFAQLLPALAKLEPHFPFFSHRDACYLSTGAQFSSDTSFAEIAMPPERLEAGGIEQLVGGFVAHRNRLRALLSRHFSSKPVVRLEGHSIHINLSAEPDSGWHLCRLLAQTAAPAYTLLTERAVSGGLILRPRPNRVEICADYLPDARYLRAALAYICGTYLAIQSAFSRGYLGDIPVWVHPENVATPQVRSGIQFSRLSFGGELHTRGRKARLTGQIAGKGNVALSAQNILEAYAEFAKERIAALASPEDLAALYSLVRGRQPLEIERDIPSPDYYRVRRTPVRWKPGALAQAYGAATRPRRLRGLRVETLFMSWEQVCFKLTTRRGLLWACVAREELVLFEQDLWSGAVREKAEKFLAARPGPGANDRWFQRTE
jgi:hypothetical protein